MDKEKTNYLQETLRVLEYNALYVSEHHTKADSFKELREKMEKEYNLKPKPIEHPGPFRTVLCDLTASNELH